MGSRSRKRQRTRPAAGGGASKPQRTPQEPAAKPSLIGDAARAAKAAQGGFRETRPQAPLRFERRARRERAPLPPGPGGRVPLTEIALVAGIAYVVIALARGSTIRSADTIAGVVVCGLAVTELTVREHLAGHRSHTLLLSFLPVVALQGLVSLTRPSPALQFGVLAIDFVVFIVLFQVWQSAYKHASARKERS